MLRLIIQDTTIQTIKDIFKAVVFFDEDAKMGIVKFEKDDGKTRLDGLIFATEYCATHVGDFLLSYTEEYKVEVTLTLTTQDGNGYETKEYSIADGIPTLTKHEYESLDGDYVDYLEGEAVELDC